ncbi:hypothetical protein ACJH6J_24720 [Mycobacterium sp. SMC-18]|uniref:hypothetical protein n=1 Tax=Mycobacterium sp. SMC-18 TaxID=3381629 RepID=UPI0038773539
MTVRAVLVCHGDPDGHHGVEFTYWSSRAEAIEASIELATLRPTVPRPPHVARLDLKPSPRPSITNTWLGARRSKPRPATSRTRTTPNPDGCPAPAAAGSAR